MTEQRSTQQADPEAELGEEIAALDREAREALDRLADRREELERRHRATDLAAQRQRERAQERRAQEARAAEERKARRRRDEAERLGRERLELEERAEEEVAALVGTLRELIDLDGRHRRALAPGGYSVFNAPRALSEELSPWFCGRFNGVVPGIGYDYRAAFGKAGPSLPERDALTPPKDASPGPSEATAGGDGGARPTRNGA